MPALDITQVAIAVAGVAFNAMAIALSIVTVNRDRASRPLVALRGAIAGRAA